jgi:uncharacterized membrane protein YdjX (TVP38/TMEM64 family)
VHALRSRTALRLGGLALTAGILLQGLEAAGGPAGLRAWLGPGAPALTVPLQALVAASPLPSDALCVANGAVYGFGVGALLSWLGWWLGALLEFALGRRARGDFDLAATLARLPGFLRRLPVGHPLFLIAARQLPWIGGSMSTFVPGAAGVPLLRLAWCQAIAILPAALLSAAIGAGLFAR